MFHQMTQEADFEAELLVAYRSDICVSEVSEGDGNLLDKQNSGGYCGTL